MTLALAEVDFAMPEGAASRSILRGFNATFNPGAFVCLTGPSGAGKTTVLSLLAGICLPSAGRLLHHADDIGALPEPARRSWRRAHVGLVFQTCRLIDVLTIAEHMDMVARLRGREDAMSNGLRIARQLGLENKLEHVPSALSGGEKQRVALAQALASCPSIVLADEPTAALDETNAMVVATTLRDFARESDAIVVAVSHDSSMIKTADHVIALQKS